MATIKVKNGNIIKNANGNISTCCCDKCSNCTYVVSVYFADDPLLDVLDLSIDNTSGCFYHGVYDYGDGDSLTVDIYYTTCWYASIFGVVGLDNFYYLSDPICTEGCLASATGFTMSLIGGEDYGEVEMETEEI